LTVGPPSTAAPGVERLNPAQEQAAATLEGPVLVIAGAGTGKTRTLVHRLVRLIQAGVSPEAILLLTFTRRAASEMIVRASALLAGPRSRIASGGTFHSFAHATLRRYGALIGLPGRFTVLDQADSFEMLAGIRAELKLGGRGRSFPRRDTIGNILSQAVNHQVTVTRIVEAEYPHLFDEAPQLERIASLYAQYKSDRGLVDFDDLLVHLIRLLRDSPRTRQALHERYTHVMVDEYQDTNVLQAEITRLLAREGGNVMVVGDDAQSIYGFRGARFTNLHDFRKTFPGTRLITLEQNYRSTQPILDVGNALLRQMSQSFRKRLFTERKGGERPFLVEAADEPEQARFVADEIDRLRKDGMALGEIAVLFRASHHAIPLELVLAQRKVRYVKYGGFRFLEAAHLKDVLAHLRVLANPRDDVSLARALALCHGIGPKGARVIARAAAGQKDLAGALRRAVPKGRKRASMEPLARLLETLQASPGRPADLLTLVIDYYTPLLHDRFDDWPRRERDLMQLVPLCETYESVEALLTDLALEPPSTASGEGLERHRPDADTLVLSTMHSAKGLEWRAVFVIQVLEGSIPMLRVFEEEPDPEQLDEDLRLLYVAVTRARDRLYLSWPRHTLRGYGYGWAECSRFVEDLPQNALEWRRARDLLSSPPESR
jgi:DNA helicase-2/ATP-dependent DNA helicase PcrA